MGKLNSVQYLRAVAVLLVVLFHCVIRVDDSISAGVVTFAKTGAAGVDLFFVISGFIMWIISAQRPTAPGTFILRRITRIVPSYWAFTLAWAAAAVIGLFPWVVVTPAHLIQSLFFIPHPNPQFSEAFPLLIPGWTLNYEMFFYVIFALCLFLPARWRLAGLCAVLGALVLTGLLRSPSGPVAMTYTSPLLLEFVAGAVIAFLYLRGWRIHGTVAVAVLVAGIALLLASSTLYADPEQTRVLAWGLPAMLIFVGVIGIPRFAGVNRPLLAIGDASYSIYLAHLFPITLLDIVYNRLPALQGSLLGALLFFVIAVPASVMLGYLAYRLIELPTERRARALLTPRRTTEWHSAPARAGTDATRP